MAKTPIRNNLVLELHIPNFDLARKFYGLLGFEELSYDPASDVGKSGLGYLVLMRRDQAGNTMINFYGDRPEVSRHNYFRQFPKDTPKGYGVEITIPVDDIEKLWKEISPKLDPASISQPLQRKRWGDQDFRLGDPFGFYVRFTEIVDWGQQ